MRKVRSTHHAAHITQHTTHHAAHRTPRSTPHITQHTTPHTIHRRVKSGLPFISPLRDEGMDEGMQRNLDAQPETSAHYCFHIRFGALMRQKTFTWHNQPFMHTCMGRGPHACMHAGWFRLERLGCEPPSTVWLIPPWVVSSIVGAPCRCGVLMT